MTAAASVADVVYPDSDGQPMADNTLQFRWIASLQTNLATVFADRPDVFVAGDNLIYPVQGSNTIRQAPDVYVAIGRPKGDRGSYKVWEEGGIFPQVVFEVRSPGNRAGEMARKLAFYDTYGAEEYYLYDPDRNRLDGYTRVDGVLDTVPEMNGFTSPLLGIRFDTSGETLVVYRPDGRPFLTYQENEERAIAAEGRAIAVEDRAIAAEELAARLARELEEARALLRAAKPDAPPG